MGTLSKIADFLISYRWGWLAALMVCFILLGVGFYAQMRLHNPKYNKDLDWIGIQLAEQNIIRHMCSDVVGAIVFFWLTAIAFGLQLFRAVFGTT